MSTDRRPQARTLATRNRVLEAVLELVAEDGPGTVTYRAVADRSGIALGALTYHFPNRRALLGAAYRHHHDRLRESARDLPIIEASTLDDDARVDLVMTFLRHMATVDRLRYLAEFELALELARDPELRAAIEPAHSETRAMAVQLLSDAGSEDPETDATIFSAAMEGLLLGWLSRPDDGAHEQRVESAVHRLVTILLPAR